MDPFPSETAPSSRTHHRWAAVLGMVLCANAAVLTLGWQQPAAILIGISAGLSSLLLALGGVSISILFPPAASVKAGLSREYTLLVSVEGLSFAVVYGFVTFVYPIGTPTQGTTAAMMVIFLLAWTALQVRLLQVAAQESVGDDVDALKTVVGTILGMLVWVAFVALTFRTFGPPTPGSVERSLLDFRLLVVMLGTVPAAAALAFVLTATFAATPPSVTTWARASTGYLTALPLLVILAMTAMALGY